MKKFTKVILFTALAVFLAGTNAVSTTIGIDGSFDSNEWAGYYSDDDGHVGPGSGGQAYDAEKMACHSRSVHEGKVKHGFITFPSDNDYFLLSVSLLETIKINVNNSRWIYVV